MQLSDEFRLRAQAYERMARQAKSPKTRQQYAAIAARCRELATDNADIVVGVPLDHHAEAVRVGHGRRDAGSHKFQ